MLIELKEANQQLQDYTEEAEKFAVAQERNRLARELHDAVTQKIFSLNLKVEAVRILLHKDPARLECELDHLQDLS